MLLVLCYEKAEGTKDGSLGLQRKQNPGSLPSPSTHSSPGTEYYTVLYGVCK